MSKTAVVLTVACLTLLAASAAPAQDAPIQDNSFLVEEAYNQEPGVVQHIVTWERMRHGGDWSASFTQEWPFLSQRHQLSYTLGYVDAQGFSGLDALAINYRYQLLGDGDARLAISPRISLLLPTGNDDVDRGVGQGGVQVNLPISTVLAPRWVAHTNAGATYVRDAESDAGSRADTLSTHLGQSLVYLARPSLNLMLEVAYENAEIPDVAGRTFQEESLFVSPGLRWAWNFPSGLQIVPGLAVPIGVGPSAGERSIFLYLSFEHPFRR